MLLGDWINIRLMMQMGEWGVFEHIIVLGLEMNHLCFFFLFFAHEWLPFCNWTGFVASRVWGVVVGTVVK